MELTIKTIQIKKSSAISKVSFWYDSNLIGITYTKSKDQDKEYLYHCDDLVSVEEQITKAEEAEESVGKLFHKLRKDGVLIQLEEFN
jgi:hypothetical protein